MHSVAASYDRQAYYGSIFYLGAHLRMIMTVATTKDDAFFTTDASGFMITLECK
jgi:hypothetical protein